MTVSASQSPGETGHSQSLRRILGVGFGLAVIVGGTVGVGILRLPGVIAGQLGNLWLILAVWVAGAVYALLGALSLAELGTALPQAGGFTVYARRAFGPAAGFAQGWADWLSNCAVVAYAAVAAAGYLAALVPALAGHDAAVALALLAGFCALHLAGLAFSSQLQKIASSLTALTFLVLAVACLLHPGVTQTYGLGVFVTTRPEFGKYVSHSGYFPGYTSNVAMFLDHGVAIAVQQNSDHGYDIYAFLKDIATAVLPVAA